MSSTQYRAPRLHPRPWTTVHVLDGPASRHGIFDAAGDPIAVWTVPADTEFAADVGELIDRIVELANSIEITGRPRLATTNDPSH